VGSPQSAPPRRHGRCDRSACLRSLASSRLKRSRRCMKSLRPCCPSLLVLHASAQRPTDLSRGRAATAKAWRSRTATAIRDCNGSGRVAGSQISYYIVQLGGIRRRRRRARRALAGTGSRDAPQAARCLARQGKTSAGCPRDRTVSMVVSDLMAFYFRSSEANDVCLQRDDQSRGVQADRDHHAEAGAARAALICHESTKARRKTYASCFRVFVT